MMSTRAAWLLVLLGLMEMGKATIPGHLKRGIIRGSEDEEVKGSRVIERPSPGHKKVAATISQLFDEPYRPQDSRHFKATASSTFSAETSKKFDLSYADGTQLKGFQGTDEIELGDFHAHAPFGVITDCNSPDFNGVDGILGFGMPKPRYYGNSLPRPILFALTDSAAPDSNTRNLPRKFSFFSTDTAAEVQLGGYDPKSTSGSMNYVPSLTHEDFSVPVTSLMYGKGGKMKELLNFKSSGDYLPAIMDSGTSCLVIPADTVYGKLKNKPWDDFVDQWAEDTDFHMTIGSKLYVIPFSSWYLADSQQTCVQPTPDGMSGLLVGDVFFRQYIVEFDMIDANRPIIGMAPLNPHYQPIRKKQLDPAGLASEDAPSAAELAGSPLHPKSTKLILTKGNPKYYPKEHMEMLMEIDRIPIVNKQGTQYFMDVGIGTPRQTFTVIFDTGSNVFGVFTYKHDLPANVKANLAAVTSVHLKADPENILMTRAMLTGKPKRAQDAATHKAAHAVEREEGVAVSLAVASSDLSAGGSITGQSSSMSFGVGVLLFAIVANVFAGLHFVSRRQRAHHAEARMFVVHDARYAPVSV